MELDSSKSVHGYCPIKVDKLQTLTVPLEPLHGVTCMRGENVNNLIQMELNDSQRSANLP